MAITTCYCPKSSSILDVIEALKQIQAEHGDIDIMVTDNDLSQTFVRECYVEYHYGKKVIELT